MFEEFVKFVRNLYSTDEFIPLHEPRFIGNEKKYLLETIDSTYVSSVGEFVNQFENMLVEYTGSKYAIAVVNGTAALHVALDLAGVKRNTEVITQSLTFVATCNAIHYLGAKPIFLDVDRTTLGLSPECLEEFLEENCELRDDGLCWNKSSNKRIVACLPMHTFGLPVQLDKIIDICQRYNVALIEDAAESLGSFYKNQHTGSFGKCSTISFNGNKIVTTGGGGMILTNDQEFASQAKHVTTTAKIPHRWHFEHDITGYNYRLPNLNAALGVAQMESLPIYIENKRSIAKQYQGWGNNNGLKFIEEPTETRANYWLNVAITENQEQRDKMLQVTNAQNIMTRPAWIPMHRLDFNKSFQTDALKNTEWLYERIVNVPSSNIL